jgi:hypothetical protein
VSLDKAMLMRGLLLVAAVPIEVSQQGVDAYLMRIALLRRSNRP